MARQQQPPPAHLNDATLLLLAEDGADVDACAHLASCGDCRERQRELVESEARLLTAAPDEETEGVAGDRRRTLAARLAASHHAPPPVAVTARGRARDKSAALAVAAVLLLAVASWLVIARTAIGSAIRRSAAHAGPVDAGDVRALPIRSITPGATLTVDVRELCRQMPWEPSPIPERVKGDVLRAYGMERVPDHEYELDYLITPDLGGSPDPRNLWPEPYHSPVWNARVKDELETLLPQLVCDGKVDLGTAQRDIAADWIAAYKKYFKTDRPLRRS